MEEYKAFMAEAGRLSSELGSSELLDFAHAWAEAMEREILLNHRRLGAIAWRLVDSLNRRDDRELDVASYQSIIDFLIEFWRYAETLRLWHNAQFAPTLTEAAAANASGGLINVAVMEMKDGRKVAIKDKLRRYLEVIGRQRRINEDLGEKGKIITGETRPQNGTEGEGLATELRTSDHS